MLQKKMPLLGHRNWIAVTDSAYPLQSREGITTALPDKEPLETVKTVLQAINEAGHVSAKVYLDEEIDYVPEEYAPGIENYRSELSRILETADVRKIPHEELISKLDEAAEKFSILIIKTDLILPYSSVFIELNCGYWSSEAEAALRKAME